jgi:uncharacterized membrane protein (DUF485 family)
MLHEPAAPQGESDHHAAPYKMRLGLWMFLVYTLVYAGFVVVNVVRPLAMERPVFRGVNLAVVYGFGLILVAFLMSLIYNRLCTARERAGKGD